MAIILFVSFDYLVLMCCIASNLSDLIVLIAIGLPESEREEDRYCVNDVSVATVILIWSMIML